MLSVDASTLIQLSGISAFLVGFMSVRLHGNVAAARTRADLMLARIAEDARHSDLLPLPTDMRRQSQDLQGGKVGVDFVATATVTVALLNFAVSSWLVWPQLLGDPSSFGLVAIQAVHLLIIVLGLFDAAIQIRELARFVRGGVAVDYEKLEMLLQQYLDCHPDAPSIECEGLTQQILNALQRVSTVIPGWCWIDLIEADLKSGLKSSRADLSSDGLGADLHPALERVRNLAGLKKATDDFSLLAWMWATALLSARATFGIVTERDLARAKRMTSGGVLRDLALRRYELSVPGSTDR